MERLWHYNNSSTGFCIVKIQPYLQTVMSGAPVTAHDPSLKKACWCLSSTDSSRCHSRDCWPRPITAFGLLCRHELRVDSWEDAPFSNETALAQAVSQTPVIVAICVGPALDDWHHYAGEPHRSPHTVGQHSMVAASAPDAALKASCRVPLVSCVPW